VALLSDDSGDFVFVAKIPEPGTEAVFKHFRSEQVCLLHASWLLFLQTSIACFENGAYFVDDEEDEFRLDYDLCGEIASQINPQVDYWQS